MLLAIDIGNTSAKFGLFEGDELIRFSVFPTGDVWKDGEKKIAEALAGHKPDKTIVSLVISGMKDDIAHYLENTVGENFRIITQGEEGIIIDKVDDYHEVGSDIMADVRGALRRYGAPCFIADLGTADKYILVDEGGALAGLAIDTGLAISSRALAMGADAISEDVFAMPPSPLGKNTKDCINAGFLYGRKYEIEGFCRDYERLLSQKPRKILTGGNASAVTSLLDGFVHEPYLSLYGLLDISKGNL